MFKLIILIAYIAGASSSGGVVEKEFTFGPWDSVDCNLRLEHYAEMYESMPGFTVLEAECKPVENGKG